MNTEIEIDLSNPSIPLPTGSLSVTEVASIVDQHAAAIWRGEEDVNGEFYRWLRSCLWVSDEREPDQPSAAKSVLAAGGAGIRWYETPSAFVGYIPGRAGAHYVIRRASELPGSLHQRDSAHAD